MKFIQKQKWQQVAEELTPDPQKMNSAAEERAVEIVEQVKEKELKTNKLAAKWEADRKKDWQTNKKYWMSKQRKTDPLREFVDAVKDGGSFKTSIRPCRGYLIVDMDKEDIQTSSIILTTSNKDEINTGTVRAIGDELPLNVNFQTLKPPAKPGDRVLLRKFAGMNIEIKGEDVKFYHFNDVIGVFDKE